MKLNSSLHLVYIPTSENEAGAPSRPLKSIDCKLHPDIWERVQRDFGAPQGHSCDSMALDSNAMTDQDGALWWPITITRNLPKILRKNFSTEQFF